MTPASDLIADYNRGREPERLAIKLAAMDDNAFAFLRGTCHLFYERLAGITPGHDAPAAWICGDLHLENFGTYLGDNGLTYFDVNDFDEAALAPASWDIIRLAASLRVAAPSLGLTAADTDAHVARLTNTWLRELAAGKSMWIERRTAHGVIGALMNDLKKRRTGKFLDKRTKVIKGNRRLLQIEGKTLPLNDAARRAALDRFVRSLKSAGQPALEFCDAARRIAGTGSLGLDRYILLVRNAAAADDYQLLDLKIAQSSSVAPRTRYAQPAWANDGERIVTAARRGQAVEPALWQAVTFENTAYVLRALQPTADRLNLTEDATDGPAFADCVATMAQLSAWSLLRASGRDASASADMLAAFAQEPASATTIGDLSSQMAASTQTDWQDYRRAYRSGTFSGLAQERAKPAA